MKACQSIDWSWSWVALAEALCTGSLDHDKLGSALRICHTKDLSCMNHPERQKHRFLHFMAAHLSKKKKKVLIEYSQKLADK